MPVQVMGFIIPIATFGLLLRYLVDTDAAKRAKYIVGGVSGASFIVPTGFLPSGAYVPMMLQLGVSIFISFYLKATATEK